MPSLAIATPVLQTFPPVVSVIESMIASRPAGGGLRRSIGSAIRSATIRPKIAASMMAGAGGAMNRERVEWAWLTKP